MNEFQKELLNKLLGILLSNRFKAALIGLLAVVISQLFDVPDETSIAIAIVIASWIYGETQRPAATFSQVRYLQGLEKKKD